MNNPFKEIDLRLSSIETLLLDLKHGGDIHAKPSQEYFLTIDETAEFLHIKKQTLYAYVSKGLIPFRKRAGRLYFPKKELIDWIKEGNKRPFDVEEEAQKIIAKRKRKGGGHG